MHVTFRSLDPSSQMKETFCFDSKVTLSKDWCFWYILLGQFHANCNLIELKQIRTSQNPFKNTIKSKYGKFYLTTSPKTLSQFYIYCCLVPTHFHWIFVVLLKNSSRALNCFFTFSWREGNLDNPFNIYTCIYQQLHNFKA